MRDWIKNGSSQRRARECLAPRWANPLARLTAAISSSKAHRVHDFGGRPGQTSPRTIESDRSAISFHPAAVASFKDALADLNAVLCEDGERPSGKLIRSVVDRVIVTPAEEKPKSPFERRSMKVEIIGELDALLSGMAVDRFTALSVREGSGSGGGT